MADMVFVNEDGAELRREKKGRGRPPKGAVKQPNGDFVLVEKPQEPVAVAG